MALHRKHESMTREEQRARSAARHGLDRGAPSASDLSRGNALAYYGSRRRRPRLSRGLRAALITVASVFLVSGIALAAYVAHINAKINGNVSSDLLSVLTDAQDNEPFYALLLGIDKDEERAQGSEYGSDSSAYRTDTIILARVDPKNKKVTLVSIPRDTYVDMEEHGRGKINSAYSFGGAAYATKVVSKLAGVPISHYAEVDMDGFAQVVDAVGGVTVDLPVPVRDSEYTGLDLPAGEQTLDGQTAALLGRTRHAYDSYGGGDFYRAANQRMLIGAVVKKVLASDPITMAGTVSTMAGHVTTDMDVSTMLSIASKFVGINVDEDIYSGQMPTESKYVNATWYEICDTAAWKSVMERVDQGLPPYADASQDSTAGIAGSVGVSAGGDGSSDAASSATEVAADYSGTVMVYNASGVAGIAGSAADKLTQRGYSAQADNASSRTDTSKVIYNGGAADKAQGVIETLGLSVSARQNDGSYEKDADVIVVLGTDRAR